MLPELLLLDQRAAGAEAVAIDPAKLPVHAVLEGVVHEFPKERPVRLRIRAGNLERAVHQPDEFEIVAVGGRLGGLRRALSETLRIPGSLHGDGRDRLPGRIELVQPAAAPGVNHVIADHIHDFHQLAPVERRAGRLVERGERFQEVHVRIEPLPVAPGKARLFGCPVAAQVFVISTVTGVGTEFLQQVERARGMLHAAPVPGAQRVFGHRVDREALPVNNLAHVIPAAIRLHRPIPAPILGIPEMPEQELRAATRQGLASADLRLQTAQAREPPDQPRLGVDVLCPERLGPALLVEMGQVAAVLRVAGARMPERDQAVRQVLGDLAFETVQALVRFLGWLVHGFSLFCPGIGFVAVGNSSSPAKGVRYGLAVSESVRTNSCASSFCRRLIRLAARNSLSRPPHRKRSEWRWASARRFSSRPSRLSPCRSCSRSR